MLDGIAADGTVRGTKGWYLVTALRAIGVDDHPGTTSEGGGGLTEVLKDRLAGWKSIRSSEPVEPVSVAVAAQMLSTSERAILARLRCGAPFVRQGNWATGEDFALSVIWLAEWSAFVAPSVARDAALYRELGFVGGAA